MKKMSLSFLTRIACSVVLSLAISTVVFAYPSGSPSAKTGSPGDGSHCVSCHGGSAVTVTGWITSNIPATGYVAGAVYTITATVTGTGKKGFEVSPQNVTGTQLGVLTAGTGNHLVGGTKYVTHNSAGSSSGTSVYNFTWTAPAPGTGTVTFYGAFTVAKANTKLSTMVVNEDVAIPLSAVASAVPDIICAGQNSQLNVVPAGGSGSYTYSWSSIPAGFTSSIQNPVVSPGVTTHYIVNVSDGTNEAEASTDVTVNQPATADAGNDTTCNPEASQVLLNGAGTNYTGVLWSTSGTGTFSAPGELSGYYLPSASDKVVGNNVTLTLTTSAHSPCSAATSERIIHFDWPTGVADIKHGEISVVIAPNPSHGVFTLKVTGQDKMNAVVTISDIYGRTVLQQEMETLDSRPEQFNLSGYPAGFYLVKIKAGSASTVRKMVIE
jgi:hypothetical protein